MPEKPVAATQFSEGCYVRVKSFSYKMREKFEEAIVECRCRDEERSLLSHLVTEPAADGE